MQPYPNPPITEALLDIRTNLPPETSLVSLASYQTKIADRFPKKDERINWEGGFQIKPGSAPEIIGPSGGVIGYIFRSEKDKKLVQARLDGFTFNKLKPYQNWDVFSVEAEELWKHYIDVAKPQRVTRLALRYINRIEIPMPFKDFKDYILTIPEIASGIPQAMNKFLMQVVIPNADINATASITETMEPISPDGKILPFILDIDVYRVVTLEPNDDKIWEIMDQLRVFKNLIFKKSVTPLCEELFK
jgi:uncharacterized protein (TIGR04255 family)